MFMHRYIYICIYIYIYICLCIEVRKKMDRYENKKMSPQHDVFMGANT